MASIPRRHQQLWRFLGARSSARCDVCQGRDRYIFHWGTVYRCQDHLGREVVREAMRRG